MGKLKEAVEHSCFIIIFTVFQADLEKSFVIYTLTLIVSVYVATLIEPDEIAGIVMVGYATEIDNGVTYGVIT